MIKITNLIPTFENFLKMVDEKSIDEKLALEKYYFSPNKKYFDPLLDDFKKIRNQKIDFLKFYRPKICRQRLLNLKKWNFPDRAGEIIQMVEKFYGKKLSGELVLFFAFHYIDGYTRFDKGKNTIYIGLDFPEADRNYFDIIIAHELNHLVRDSNQKVLKAYGANMKMNHFEYIQKMNFAEHLISEGLAGYFSSVIFPGKKPWEYLFYTKKQYDWCVKHRDIIEKSVLKSALSNGDWKAYYKENYFGSNSPERTQYFFGFELIKRAAKKYSMKQLTFMSAQEIINEFLLK
jgi:hypothetical protein